MSALSCSSCCCCSSRSTGSSSRPSSRSCARAAARLEQLAEEGGRGAAPVARRSSTTSTSTSPPARSGSRWPRSASASSASPRWRELIEPIFGSLSHGVAAAISVAIAFTLVTALHISVGEQVPKLLAITPRRAHRAPRLARPLHWFRTVDGAVHGRADRGSPTRSCACSGSGRQRSRGAAHLRRPEDDHHPRARSAASSTRARPVMLAGVFHLHEQEAREVMTPIPAVVTVDASRDARGGAAALRLLRPHPAARGRGRQPRPGQGASSTTSASPASTWSRAPTRRSSPPSATR